MAAPRKLPPGHAVRKIQFYEDGTSTMSKKKGLPHVVVSPPPKKLKLPSPAATSRSKRGFV
jgi:hypothetical protein